METIVVLAAALFVFGLALWALERIPLPAQPAWIRRAYRDRRRNALEVLCRSQTTIGTLWSTAMRERIGVSS